MIPRNIGELLPIERTAEAGGAGAHPRDTHAPGGRSGQRWPAASGGHWQRAAGGNLDARRCGAGDRVGFPRGSGVTQQTRRPAGPRGKRQAA
jgi:hypothetical protein